MTPILVLAAVSAPTAAAVKRAEDLNLLLVGFLRKDGHVVYSMPRQVTGSDQNRLDDGWDDLIGGQID